MMNRILLIEDDANLAFMLTDGLESEGFEVYHITRGEDAIDAFTSYEPNIILLDVNLKGVMTGFDVSKEIRKISNIPIIFTTSRSQIEDLKEGFKVGNVDYLKKPYSIRELGLRINAQLIRYQELQKATQTEEECIHLANYVFSPSDQTLQNIDTIHLQKNESAVLSILCENIEKVVSKKDLLESIWGDKEIPMREASLYNVLFSLRAKLSADSSVAILTIPKLGYKLSVVNKNFEN
ncbi:MAG: response regulator transcription factor [Bacteroidales bacterium]|nr:response regulator transcription factor [Bacteroidales bacterium]